MEVAQIAGAIARMLNETLDSERFQIDLDLVEFAGLAHDLGHAPFGHNGEDVLNDLMIRDGGFEGNAQTLRLLTRLEKRLDDPETQLGTGTSQPKWYGADGEEAIGLNLCARSLAAILKYDSEIPNAAPPGSTCGNRVLAKGYYRSERAVVAATRKHVAPGLAPGTPMKTVECQIMDLADDIAYSTSDLEDALKSRLLSPLSIVSIEGAVLERISLRVSHDVGAHVTSKEVVEVLDGLFYMVSERFAKLGREAPHFSDSLRAATRSSELHAGVGHFRTIFLSELVNRFIGSITIAVDERCPKTSPVTMASEALLEVAVLKRTVYETLIKSDRFRVQAIRARRILKFLFSELVGARVPESRSADLLPVDWRERFNQASLDTSARARVVCDFIAGMTDRQAVETYSALASPSFRSIFAHF